MFDALGSKAVGGLFLALAIAGAACQERARVAGPAEPIVAVREPVASGTAIAGVPLTAVPVASAADAAVSGHASPLDQVRATCAGKLRCPPDKPVCAATKQGPPHCVARGSAEYFAVPSDARFLCTHQSDCLTEEGCFLTFGEHEVEWHTYCGPYAGGQAACDMSTNCDEAKDPTCVPCITFGLAGMPWFGFH